MPYDTHLDNGIRPTKVLLVKVLPGPLEVIVKLFFQPLEVLFPVLDRFVRLLGIALCIPTIGRKKISDFFESSGSSRRAPLSHILCRAHEWNCALERRSKN